MPVLTLRSMALTNEEAAVLLATLIYAKGKAGHDLLTPEGLAVLDVLIGKAKEVSDDLLEASKGGRGNA